MLAHSVVCGSQMQECVVRTICLAYVGGGGVLGASCSLIFLSCLLPDQLGCHLTPSYQPSYLLPSMSPALMFSS